MATKQKNASAVAKRLRLIKTTDKIKDPKTKKVIKTSARRYIDTRTKKIYTYRQSKKIRPPKTRAYKSKKAKPGEISTRAKLRSYANLARSFAKKQDLTVKAARESKELKKILKDLKEGYKLKTSGRTAAERKKGNKLMLNALKQTSLRDNIPDNIPVGESPKAGQAEAA